jgi:hypothetical protein
MLTTGTTQPRDAVRETGEELLAHLDELVDRLVAAAPSLPGYGALPPETFRPGVHSFVGWIVEQALVHQTMPGDLDREVVHRAFEARSRVVGISAVLAACETTFGALFDAALEAAERRGISRPDLLALTRHLSAWERSLYTLAMELGVQVAQDEVTRTQQRKTRLLQDLLIDGADPELALGAGLSGQHVMATRLRSDDPQALLAVERRLDADARRRSQVALTAVLGGDLVAIVCPPLDLATFPGTVGAGRVCEVDGLPESFRSATRALETAVALGLTGVHSEASLGPKVAVATDHRLGDQLVQRYLVPLDDLGAFGVEMVRTLRCFLANDLRLDRTAAELFVHRSTLKYRLRRYEDLTGTRLHQVDDIVGLWWALTRAGDGLRH